MREADNTVRIVTMTLNLRSKAVLYIRMKPAFRHTEIRTVRTAERIFGVLSCLTVTIFSVSMDALPCRLLFHRSTRRPVFSSVPARCYPFKDKVIREAF